MGLFNASNQDIATPPVFIEIHSDYKGGGTLSNVGFADKSLLRAGTLVNIDEYTRLVTVLKTAVIVEAAAAGAVAYKIAKQHNYQSHFMVLGDILGNVVGGAAYGLTAIDTTNAVYDIITVPTSLGALNVGDILFTSSAAGANAAALKVTVNGHLRNDTIVSINQFVAVVRQGITYNRRLPFATPQAVKDALKGIIFFSEQR